MSSKKKPSSTPKTGNKASSFMPWQQINKSPVMVLSKFQDSDESSSTDDEEEKEREESEKKPKGDDLDETPSLWGGGSHALISIESLDGNRALCVPRNSPGYYAARREAERAGTEGRARGVHMNLQPWKTRQSRRTLWRDVTRHMGVCEHMVFPSSKW